MSITRTTNQVIEEEVEPWSHEVPVHQVDRHKAWLVARGSAGPRAELRPDLTPFAEHERKELR